MLTLTLTLALPLQVSWHRNPGNQQLCAAVGVVYAGQHIQNAQWRQCQQQWPSRFELGPGHSAIWSMVAWGGAT